MGTTGVIQTSLHTIVITQWKESRPFILQFSQLPGRGLLIITRKTHCELTDSLTTPLWGWLRHSWAVQHRESSESQNLEAAELGRTWRAWCHRLGTELTSMPCCVVEEEAGSGLWAGVRPVSQLQDILGWRLLGPFAEHLSASGIITKAGNTMLKITVIFFLSVFPALIIIPTRPFVMQTDAYPITSRITERNNSCILFFIITPVAQNMYHKTISGESLHVHLSSVTMKDAKLKPETKNYIHMVKKNIWNSFIPLLKQ